jgi:hypothetical protein
MEQIPHRRSDNPKREPQDKNNGDQQGRGDKLERSNFIGWRNEMQPKDKINKILRPSGPHQKRPKQMPHCADYSEDDTDNDLAYFHRLSSPIELEMLSSWRQLK